MEAGNPDTLILDADEGSLIVVFDEIMDADQNAITYTDLVNTYGLNLQNSWLGIAQTKEGEQAIEYSFSDLYEGGIAVNEQNQTVTFPLQSMMDLFAAAEGQPMLTSSHDVIGVALVGEQQGLVAWEIFDTVQFSAADKAPNMTSLIAAYLAVNDVFSEPVVQGADLIGDVLADAGILPLVDTISVTDTSDASVVEVTDGEGSTSSIGMAEVTFEISSGPITDVFTVEVDVTFSELFADGEVRNFTQGTSHSTIQAAIDAADPGDALYVGAGSYPESVTVNVEDLEIVGAGADVVTVEPADYDVGFDVQVNSVHITAFEVTGDGRPIHLSTDIADGIVAIIDNTLRCTSDHYEGILVDGDVHNSDIILEANVIEAGDEGIFVAGNMESSEVTVRDNTIDARSEGFRWRRYRDLDDSTLVIRSNTFVSENAAGLSFHFSANFTASIIMIEDNTITADSDGISMRSVIDDTEVTIADNTITSEDYVGLQFGVFTGSTVNIEGNHITAPQDDGVNFSDIGNTVLNFQDNIINSLYTGMRFNGDIELGSEVTIIDNDITSNSEMGVSFRDAVDHSEVTIAANTINAADEGVYLRDILHGEVTVNDNVIEAGDEGVRFEFRWDYRVLGSTVSIRGNEITGSTEGMMFGNVQDSTDAPTVLTLKDNTLEGNSRGVVFYQVDLINETSQIQITGNDFIDNLGAGLGFEDLGDHYTDSILSMGDAQLNVSTNRFDGNSMGVTNSTGGDVVDARENWWGDSSGPTHAENPDGTGDGVSDHVIYEPWYVDEQMTELSE